MSIYSTLVKLLGDTAEAYQDHNAVVYRDPRDDIAYIKVCGAVIAIEPKKVYVLEPVEAYKVTDPEIRATYETMLALTRELQKDMLAQRELAGDIGYLYDASLEKVAEEIAGYEESLA